MANEYSLINSSGVQYDEAGNLTKDEDGYAMRYDGDGQLDLVYLDADSNGSYNSGDTAVGEYKYDALGRRIEFKNYYDGSGIYCGSTPCTVTTRYVQDGHNVIAEYNAASTPVRQRYFVHGTSYIDERAVMRDEVPTTPKDYYYLLKDLYTPVGLVNKQGHEVERYVYDAYGKAAIWSTLTGDVNFNGEVNGNDRSVLLGAWTSGQGVCGAAGGPIFDLNADGLINGTDRSVLVGQWTNPNNQNTKLPASKLGNPYAFTGRTLDVFKDAISGSPGTKPIYHYRARYYDPEHGRFEQRDPSGYRDGMDQYEYVQSNPCRFSDPSGNNKNVPYASTGCDTSTGRIVITRNLGYKQMCTAAQGCVDQHEAVHEGQLAKCCRRANLRHKAKPNNIDKTRSEFNKWQDVNYHHHECEAYNQTMGCYDASIKLLATCGPPVKGGQDDCTKCLAKLKDLQKAGKADQAASCGAIMSRTKTGEILLKPYEPCPFDENGNLPSDIEDDDDGGGWPPRIPPSGGGGGGGTGGGSGGGGPHSAL